MDTNNDSDCLSETPMASFRPWNDNPLAKFSKDSFKNIPECIVNMMEHLVKDCMNTHFKINDVKKEIAAKEKKNQAKFTKLHKVKILEYL